MTSITPTYNTSFPALYSVGNTQHKRKSSHATTTALQHSLAPPKYPPYLKQTLYGSLALEQYHHFQAHHHTHLHTTDLEDEQWEMLDLRLPTFWNVKDKSKSIEVGSNGLDLSYVGPGQLETHAALVRANYPMRYQCGVFYFEMKVKSKGDDGYIGIGFCYDSNKLERLPGWDADSWGYHGDDGHSFTGSGTGKTYGPRFSTGDVIGCGVNFADNSAFYTKNGKFLGVAFTDMKLTKPIYPAIGLRTPGEQVTANFGHEPFVYDIAQYVKDQKARFLAEITSSFTEFTQASTKQVMDQLVLSYLVHHGYTSTAKAVVQNVGHVSGQELFLSDVNSDVSEVGTKDMEERHVIRSAIINGRIDEATQLINTYFPGVLEEEGRGQDLQLWLKCGRFIEMMRDYCESNKTRIEQPRSKKMTSPSMGGKRRPSYASIAATLSPSSSADLPEDMTEEDMMDIDSHPSDKSNGNAWKRRFSSCSGANDHLETDETTGNSDALKQIMLYGQKLQEEYRHDTNEITKSKLVEIFSLLAYPDPYLSPLAYLLDISRRDALATEVNAAILAHQNRPEMPAMERIYRQIILCNKELAGEGNGRAVLMNIDDYCAHNRHALSSLPL